VPGADEVELAVGEPLSQELGIFRRHRLVAGAGDDLHGRLDLRQQVAQDRKLGRVGSHVPRVGAAEAAQVGVLDPVPEARARVARPAG
jgi:hypothetical protein